MLRILSAAVLCLALSACVQTKEVSTAKKEANLWRTANSRAAKECSSFPKADRSRALAANNCVANIVRKVVLPYAAYPDLVVNLIDAQAETSRRYHDGKIDQSHANAEAQQLQAQYQASVMHRLYGR